MARGKKMTEEEMDDKAVDHLVQFCILMGIRLDHGGHSLELMGQKLAKSIPGLSLKQAMLVAGKVNQILSNARDGIIERIKPACRNIKKRHKKVNAGWKKAEATRNFREFHELYRQTMMEKSEVLA